MEPNRDDAIALFFDAIREGDENTVRAMLTAEPGLADARHKTGATPVLWAVYRHHSELAAILLADREADFFEACALGNASRVRTLLDMHPEFHRQDSADGFSPLGLAAYFGHLQTAGVLVGAGADVNHASPTFQVTPLHSAVASRSAEIVELLLSCGASPNSSEPGGSPLHSAACTGDQKIVKMLLAAGADPRQSNKAGKTPPELAREYGHAELARQLESLPPQ